MKLPITGRCLCGEMKYEINVQPRRTGLCYCKSCQIKSGSDHIAYIVVDIDSVKIDGPVKWYQFTGGSGTTKQQGSCPTCSATLFGKPNLWPEILVVYAGSLDHPNDFKPAVNIWLQDAPDWVSIDKNLECFEQNPS